MLADGVGRVHRVNVFFNTSHSVSEGKWSELKQLKCPGMGRIGRDPLDCFLYVPLDAFALSSRLAFLFSGSAASYHSHISICVARASVEGCVFFFSREDLF